VRRSSAGLGFEFRTEDKFSAIETREWRADHRENHVGCETRLGRWLGVDNPRWWRRRMASLDERAMAANQRLVRAFFRPFGLPGDRLVPEKIRRSHGLRLCSNYRCRLLFRCRKNRLVFWIVIQRSRPQQLVVSLACTIIIRLAAGPDGRCY